VIIWQNQKRAQGISIRNIGKEEEVKKDLPAGLKNRRRIFEKG